MFDVKLSIEEIEDIIFERQEMLAYMCKRVAELGDGSFVRSDDPFSATWRHFKGGLYRIVDLGVDRNNVQEVMIHYTPIHSSPKSGDRDRRRVIFDATFGEWVDQVQLFDASGQPRTVNRFTPVVTRGFEIGRDAAGQPIALTSPMPV
jgi:hypothetical protein